MKKTFWLVSLMLMAVLSLSGSLAFAQGSAADLYNQGLEDLRNNMDADAAEKLEQAAAAASPGEELSSIQYALAYAHARQWGNSDSRRTDMQTFELGEHSRRGLNRSCRCLVLVTGEAKHRDDLVADILVYVPALLQDYRFHC